MGFEAIEFILNARGFVQERLGFIRDNFGLDFEFFRFESVRFGFGIGRDVNTDCRDYNDSGYASVVMIFMLMSFFAMVCCFVFYVVVGLRSSAL